MMVVLIPEDSINDRYILKPIFERLLRNLSFANPKVVVCSTRMRGVSEAMKPENLNMVVERYPMADLFILCVDRDCNINRRGRLNKIENRLAGISSR